MTKTVCEAELAIFGCRVDLSAEEPYEFIICSHCYIASSDGRFHRYLGERISLHLRSHGTESWPGKVCSVQFPISHLEQPRKFLEPGPIR
jgi:hypothetical protein